MKYSEKYGQPQGNELVYGADIIRRTDTFEFTLIERFKSSHAAHTAYKQWGWMKIIYQTIDGSII